LVSPGATMPPFTILAAFSGARQTMVNTGYNRRVAECAEATRTLLDAAGHTDAAPLLE
jgi:galactokinase